MPSTKQSPLAKTPAPPAKSLKKHAPPPPHEQHPHEKPGKHEKPAKGGKKHAGKQDKPAGKHLRRAYEHLGRVEALQTLAQADSITTLVQLAQSGVERDIARPAADLLRAAEHLSFAAIAAKSASASTLSADLEEAVRREFRKLLEAAEDHQLALGTTLDRLLRQAVEDARAAFDTGSFRQALELARAAEALAAIHEHDAEELEPTTLQLSKSAAKSPERKAGKRPAKA